MLNKFQLILLGIPFFLSSCTDINNTKQIDANTKSARIVSTPRSQNATFKNISAKQFHEKIETGGIILDVRTPAETARGSIKNASFINLNDRSFLQKINLMQKEQPIFVYCASGSRSSHAAQLMIQNGFKEVYNLNGGIRAWSLAGFEVVKSKSSNENTTKQISLIEFENMISVNQPILIDFHTAWCAPCKKMAPIVEQLKTDYSGKAEVVKIDVDQNSDVANHYNIRGVPVFIIFKNGKEVWRHSGALAQNKLEQMLDEVISK